MYAIVETGNQQYKVTTDTSFEVERLNAPKGEKVKLDNILLVSDGEEVKVGTPYVKGAKVVCEIIAHIRGKKVIAFKYRRRKASKSKIGHRRDLTRLKVQKIQI